MAFEFVDFWDGGAEVRKKWQRISVRSIDDHRERLQAKVDIFHTVQIFERSQFSDGERHICPLFFDIDHDDLATSLESTQLILQHLIDELEIDPKNIACKFSGSKGFHIVVNPYALGCRPSVNATAAVRRAAFEVAQTMGLKHSKEKGDDGTFDSRVYSVRRMLRLPGSLRESGRRACSIPAGRLVEMVVDDVLGWNENEEVRPMVWAHCDASTEAIAWFGSHQDAADLEETLSPDARGFLKKSSGPTDLPVCMKDLLQPRLKQPGSRNQATFMMGISLKDLGWNPQDIQATLMDWTRAVHAAETGQSCPSHVERNAKGTIKSALSGEKKPVCRAILALGGKEQVTCQGTSCPWVAFQEESKHEWEAPELTLNATREATRYGRKAKVRGMVCQHDPSPYPVPAEVKVECVCDDSKCGAKSSDPITVEHRAVDTLAYLTAETSAAAHKALEKRCLTIASAACKGRIKVERWANYLECTLQPDLEAGYSGAGSAFSEHNAFLPIESAGSHELYKLEVVPLQHPKTGQLVLMATKAERCSRAHEDLEVTPELVTRLSQFQTGDDAGSVLKSLEKRHAEYEGMHGIIGRKLESLALSLVWHSVLAFRCYGKNQPRGWLDIIAVGDTAQGKTEITNFFHDWFGCGEMISGENVTLAGLTCGVETKGKRSQVKFGAYVRQDTGLLTTDEFHEMEDRHVKGTSQARSSGVVRSDKIASAMAMGRCRKIALSNPTKRKGSGSCSMSQFDFGCQSLLPIFSSPEDLRRCDYAIGFAKKEELTEHMNRVSIKDSSRDQSADQDLVMWAWSRTQDQVRFELGVEERMLELSGELARQFYCDIPILDPGDTKSRVARLACAVAASVFSCDETGEQLVVKVGHAEAAATILRTLAESDDLDLGGYAAMHQSRQDITSENLSAIINRLHTSVGIRDGAVTQPAWVDLLITLKDAESVGYTVPDMTSISPYSSTEINEMLRVLAQERLVRKSSGMGFVLSERGRLFVRQLIDLASTPKGVIGSIADSSKFGGTPDYLATPEQRVAD